jgi:uncharacterized repeat protein (TIGR03803 family)
VEKVLYNVRGGTGIGDGAFPRAGLIDVDGVLYGTTYNGGNDNCNYPDGGCGIVYSISTTGSEKVLHRFNDVQSNGSLPQAGLCQRKRYAVRHNLGGWFVRRRDRL